jgi:hypothetical protein
VRNLLRSDIHEEAVPPQASRLLSPANAKLWIAPVAFGNRRTSCQLLVFQILTVRSLLPEARYFPSGLKATLVT